MDDSQVQYISDDAGKVTGVILPIQLWQSIIGELETQHLLKDDATRQRLLEAKNRLAVANENEVSPYNETQVQETTLLEQLAATEAVVWSPHNAHDAAQVLAELLETTRQADNA